ncbi:MAG: hypothetical protein JXA19_05525 [Anaerolineales bacterium]|nr:hypothetical protein [Anaerolineales bacterium]
MDNHFLEEIHRFIIIAKQATYVGNGAPSPSHRPDSHDLDFRDGSFSYMDSYFGGQDFIGQEVVYYDNKAIWAMNYYGYILDPDKITGAEAGKMIKESLSALYLEGRYLGGYEHKSGEMKYVDTNEGDFSNFTGKEWIEIDGKIVYELVYHGGLIK